MRGHMDRMMRSLAAVCIFSCTALLLADGDTAGAQAHYDYIVTDGEFGADVTDRDSDARAIQRAFEKAIGAKEPVTIYFPAGTYYIDKPLRIYSNTHLVLDDNAVIYRMDSLIDRGLLHNVDQDGRMDVTGGYDMSENITIEGGTWDGGDIKKASKGSDIIRFDHARNITVKDCTVRNTYDCHLIEFVGIEGGSISGCTLTGFRYRQGHSNDWAYAREAVQLESAWTNNEADKTEVSSLWAKGSVVDGTSCRKVAVTGNRVIDFPCGIGQHHYTKNGKHRNEDITISGNTITCPSSWKHCKTAITCGGMNQVLISENVVKGPYRFSVHVVESDGVNIQKNKMAGISMNGIMVDSGKVKAIAGNTLSSVRKHGISVGGGTVTRIEGNIVKGAKIDGLSVDGGSVKLICGNTFQNIKKHGISITGGAIGTGRSRSTGIQKNKIRDCRANGISVSVDCRVSAVRGNKITGVRNNGISVTDRAKVYWITGNTIRKCKKHGIWNGSTVRRAKVGGNKGKVK
ncbi:MAG: hypothetical protein HFH72_07300 [Lachnospiraceae bacterium]|nr:hypothetical protein [Lachnospiraceae bacterium]